MLRPRTLLVVVVLQAVVATACISSGSDTPTVSTTVPSAAPDKHQQATQVDANSFDTRFPIKHVIFVIKENRSFDHMFGRFPGANGVTEGEDANGMRPLTPEPDDHHDIPHCYECSLQAYNNGQMNGFSQGTDDGAHAFTQFRPWDIPNLWYLAQHYVLSDNFFASAQGPSFPNHLYSIAATSGGTHEAPHQSPDQLKERWDQGLAKTWGCDAPKGVTVTVEDSEGVDTEIPPCFDFQTEGDLLNAKKIPWAYYSATNTQAGYIWSAYSAIRRYRENPKKWAQHIRPVDDLVHDIRKGLLPPITWVAPRAQESDHADGNSFCNGYNWTTDVVNALMESPMWDDTAMFVTWDDYGGYYDHVPPRQVDPFGFGMRVPLLTISSYARDGMVDHHPGEFSSVLRFIEDNWGLTQLTHRDRDAKNLSYNFDFTQGPRPPSPELPKRTDCPTPVFSGPSFISPGSHGDVWLPDQTQPDGSKPATPAPAPPA